ncbi:uncharacterized protein PG986_008821 [Apiospora aurea]|uniref:Protein kinase domain-containing protein n=1 Tax=Apiospora aurea TaxID=335848 RepID=A0ABR1Q672_9PEZI
MSTAALRKYRQAGVFLPHYRGNRASADRENARGIVADKGFLFVKELGGDKLFLVQSVANNRLNVNKILVRTDDDQNGDFKTQLPPELRFSTIGAPGPRNVQFDYLIDETYFTKLDYWKRLNAKTYSLYFQFANGGTLEQLIEKYRELGDEVPEHFIWHVAVELGEALNDLVPNNVFINYAPVGQSRGNCGTVKNAFPEIVLGDFGLAARDGDPAADLLPSVHFDDPALAGHPARGRPNAWEDVHYYGAVLRRLFMASIAEADYQDANVITPEQFTVRAANTRGLPAGRRRYSAALEAWLREFEWPNMDGSDIEQSQRTRQPTVARLLDTLLPTVRAELRAHRLRMRDYTGANDVSWTKPPELMLYVYTDEADPDLRGLDRWSTTRALPRRAREHRRRRFMEWPVPYHAEIDARVDVSKPRPQPPPPGGGGGGGDDSDEDGDEDGGNEEEEEEDVQDAEDGVVANKAVVGDSDEDGDVQMGGS